MTTLVSAAVAVMDRAGKVIDDLVAANAQLKRQDAAMLEALELLLDSLGALTNPTELDGMGLTDEQQEMILRAYRLAKGESHV